MPTPSLPLRQPQPWAERAWQGTLTAALGALGFFVPFSTAGTSIAVAVLLILAALAPMRVWRTGFWREGVLVLSLALLAYVVLRSVAEDGWHSSALHPARKYQELLLLPLFWALLRNARRPQVFATGLIVGSLVMAALYWVGWAAGLTRANQLGEWLHMHRISAGFTLAVSAFVMFEHTRLGHLSWVRGLAATFFLAGAVLFASDGRTGHIVLLALVCCALLRMVPRRARLLAFPVVLALAIGVGAMSGAVRERIHETIADLNASHEINPTAVRMRILRNAIEVAQQNWVLGTGWNHYRDAFDEATQRHARVGPTAGEIPAGVAGNPHSEFLLQLGAGGIPALALFLAWLAWPAVQAYRERRGNPWAGALACVALAFGLAAVFNSVLFDYIEAHYYAALLAWLMARRAAD